MTSTTTCAQAERLARECETAARIVRELSMSVSPIWADHLFPAGRRNGRTTRSAWLALMDPSLGPVLAGLLDCAAGDIRYMPDSWEDRLESIYSPHLSLARHIIDYAPAVPR